MHMVFGDCGGWTLNNSSAQAQLIRMHPSSIHHSFAIRCDSRILISPSDKDKTFYFALTISRNAFYCDVIWSHKSHTPQSKVEGNEGNGWQQTAKDIVSFPVYTRTFHRVLASKQCIWQLAAIHYLYYLLFLSAKPKQTWQRWPKTIVLSISHGAWETWVFHFIFDSGIKNSLLSRSQWKSHQRYKESKNDFSSSIVEIIITIRV